MGERNRRTAHQKGNSYGIWRNTPGNTYVMYGHIHCLECANLYYMEKRSDIQQNHIEEFVGRIGASLTVMKMEALVSYRRADGFLDDWIRIQRN